MGYQEARHRHRDRGGIVLRRLKEAPTFLVVDVAGERVLGSKRTLGHAVREVRENPKAGGIVEIGKVWVKPGVVPEKELVK